MFFVYAIDSQVRTYTYVGLTDNIERRLEQHNKGYNKTTKAYRPFKLFYQEQFETRIEARQREKYLKSGVGREYLKKLKTTQ
ncbi:endonuclease [Roseivirga sp. 4D4]|uniref:GIY-YIG nuclease family protein n=1 Tax=Roseivirga sp. 4D4 TaxID=1889784 RepID=UPI00085353E7|nr:GIY-YIG nuclease family protein [Roseivirga sp. 4D4]OEK02883.1 endonuclease [Roseivirga sp. 4D4]